MSKKLSFSIAVNLLTENFKKGTRTVKNSLRSMQMQVLTFAAALGAGGLGVAGLISRFKNVARETSNVITALKNVSEGTRGFAENLRFVNEMANKYGLEINALTGNFAKFTASATQANMPMEQQKKVFESLSRASTAFGLSAQDTNGVFLALSQMMGKGKISSEELRKQMGERIPIAMQAMAKAAGVSMGELEKLLQQGKLISSDMIPKFAEALNDMIPNVETDSLEGSLNKLSNAFQKIVSSSGFQNKYKALIDWLVKALDSASKNIQNIFIGMLAAVTFAVSARLTKVYRQYAETGKSILANEQITSRKMRVATQQYTDAKNRLRELELLHARAVGKQQVALAQRIEQAKLQIQGKAAYARAAIADRVAAREATEHIKRSGRMGTIAAMFTGAAKKVGSAIESMWKTFAPALVFSAIAAIVAKFFQLRAEAKRIKNIFSDYKKEAQSIGNTQELVTLKAQLSIMNDKRRSQEEINGAQKALQKLLGTEKTTQEELNKLVAKRVSLIEAQAKSDFYSQKKVKIEVQMEEIANEYGGEKHMQEMVEYHTENTTAINKWFNVKAHPVFPAMREYKELKKVRDDIASKLTEIISSANTLSENNAPTPDPDPAPDPNNDPQKLAEKRLEALQRLTEEQRRLEIAQQKFELEMQQKEIDILDDGFEKRIKQMKLNFEKEELAIDEHQVELLRKQKEYAKTKYISEYGTDKGFDSHFDKLQANGFKDKQGIDILPDGLRPDDLAAKMATSIAAAEKIRKKGLADINKDLSALLREQEMMFASDLDKKLADINNYYQEQLLKAKGNAEAIALLEKNRDRETEVAKTDDKLKKLDFEEQLSQERAAGMESIGMTELAEEKKLEISKRFLKLRIETLQELADAGDEDAKRQIAMYQAALDGLDTQKPVKSLKALADRAIFDRIAAGFKKAGASAEEAEAKTNLLLGAIRKNAGMIANIASELKGMFGGLSDDLDMALDTVGNIAEGFASGGIAGGAMAVIGEGMKMFGKASEAAKRHQKALQEIANARLASQRAYNLLLLEQNLLMKEATSIFGEKQISRASNALFNYKDSLQQLQTEMQGGFAPDEAIREKLQKQASKGGFGGYIGKKELNEYNKQIDNYKKGIASLGNAKIITGHQKTGLFGWGKGKDVYTSILDKYPDILDNEGKLKVARLQTIIQTEKMSDETKNYLENLVNLENQAKNAQEELKNYLQSTFGALGNDLMNSLENAIKDKGINAWEAFGDAGAKVIGELGKQIAYELFFAEKFKNLQSELEAVYGSGKGKDEIAKDAMDLVGTFYQGIGSQMELAQGFMENWQKESEKYGMKPWQADTASFSQDSTKGYSTAMDQDTGGSILGRVTGIHESIIDVLAMVGTVNVNSIKSLTQTIGIGDELKKHTEIFNEMRDFQQKTHKNTEKLKESIESLLDIKDDLSSINKNTKGLAPR